MAADQAGNAAAGEVSREKILHAIASLLANKDATYIAGVRSRAAKGNLQIKGQNISEEMVTEALSRVPKGEEKPKVQVETTMTTPVVSAGLRWTPSSASIQAVVSKALMECEEAEPYMERVRVVGDSKVAVLPKPDVNTTPTGEYLASDEWADAVARVVSRKDGRVYVRLRNHTGWVSSRSRKDYAKVVLDVEEGKPSLEPSSMQVIGCSRATRLLPNVTQDGYQVSNHSGSKLRRFRTTVMVPILQSPDGNAASVAKVQAKEEFLADGAYLRAEDGRAYLHLKDGRGWICERARADFSKLAVEPCGSAEDLVELEDTGVLQPARARAGKKKVFVLEHSAAVEAPETVAHDAAQPGADSDAAPAETIFRSDIEIWPEDMHPPKPINKTIRLKLWRLFVCHGVKLKECHEDLKEVSEKAGSFGRACAAQKELLQYAEDLKKEMQKVKKEWSAAVKKELDGAAMSGHAPDKVEEPTSGGASAGAVMPVQVRGGRWFCATLTSRSDHDGEDAGATGHGSRQSGPLRPSAEEAAEDLKRMLQARDSKRKAEATSDPSAAPAKRGRRAVKSDAKDAADDKP
mmetsp:Transcript_60693/g.141938  ORF Transcript_60693/g.141938 Transcript_60693/m.141938 type:complete len:576 (+) Transcript_60693:36-1763(+)